MSSDKPIGIFDSGIGGLTVLREIQKYLPEYDYMYLGDNARTPYGTRSFEVVYQYTLESVKKLFSLGCHLIILACNTASAKALRTIQQNDLPSIDPGRRVLGVIRPSVEAIKLFTSGNHVGVLGTEGTVNSESYILEIQKLYPEIITVQEACPMWVPLVENNELDNQGSHFFVKKNLDNLLQKDPQIDTIILGCTHYPLLLPVILQYIPKQIKVISQGKIVAESLKDYLFRHPEMENKCSKYSKTLFYTTENPSSFRKRANIFLDKEIEVRHISL